MKCRIAALLNRSIKSYRMCSPPGSTSFNDVPKVQFHINYPKSSINFSVNGISCGQRLDKSHPRRRKLSEIVLLLTFRVFVRDRALVVRNQVRWRDNTVLL